MKQPIHLLTLIALATVVLLPASLFAQGSLTPPPGAPAPVMKTLDQVEARRPLVEGQPGVSISVYGTITIDQPGSYYLTNNLVITTAGANGIVVNSSDVTLDLNGYALVCTAVNGGDAVSISQSSVKVLNGSIKGSGSTGWNNGVNYSNVPTGIMVSDLRVYGVRGTGIELPSNGSRVERCLTDTTGSQGISASSVTDSTAINAQDTAIYAGQYGERSQVNNCIGRTAGTATSDVGIEASTGNILNSQGISINGYGINAENVINSQGRSAGGIGLAAIIASNCDGRSDTNTGLTCNVASNCRRVTTTGSYGLTASGTASYCVGLNSGGVAIQAAIAIGCTTISGTVRSPSKHLGTP